MFEVGSKFYVYPTPNPNFLPDDTYYVIEDINDGRVVVGWIRKGTHETLEYNLFQIESYFKKGSWVLDIKDKRRMKLTQLEKNAKKRYEISS